MRYALLQKNKFKTHINELLKESKSISKSLEIAQFLNKFIKEKFFSLFSPEQPSWFTRLFLQAMSDISSSLKAIVEEYFVPELNILIDIFRRLDPNMSEKKATLWAFSIQSQIAFY